MNEISSQPVSILVIEDDSGDFGLIRAHVQLSGLAPSGDKEPVIWAKTLGEGIAAAQSNKPDVVLLDLSLPDSAGLDTVRAIRVAIHDVPIVVLTGHEDNALAIAALQAGAQDYLVKGKFDHDALGRAVRHALVRGTLESRLRLFEVAMNSVANGIVITDIHAHILWVNPAFTQLTGFSLEEVLGRHLGKLVKFGKHDPAFYQNMWETILSGQAWHGEVVNRRKDGSFYDESLIITPVTDDDGTTRHFVAIMQNITERKQAELKAAALIHRNHVLMQSTSEGIHVLDEQGNVIEANEAFCHHLGYTMAEVLQLSVFDFDAKLSADELRANLKEMQNGQALFETVHRRKDGTLVDVEINISGVDLEGQKCLFALSRDITRKKETEQIIWKQANFDALTGLPNRHMFHERMEQEIKKSTRSCTPFALMFIDLDHFKEVNDTLGHDMGDVLLIEATRRITDCVRATDIVARMGGDEFTVLLTEVDDFSSVERIAQSIIQKLAASFQLKKEKVYVSASIGITLYPNDATDIEGLLKNADQAMYVAKEKGRNRHSYFTPALYEAAQAKLRLVNDLRGALAANQFMVYFQPIVELATGNIHKAEALIRWRHPERGMVNPAQFIPLAEETGLILEIGDWVFHESMRYAKRWRTLYNPVFQVSVNKSPIQFYKDGEEHTAWLSYLKEIDLPGQGLTIEITEGLLLDSNASINGALLTLRNAYIQVSIDDFGTGYSSLSYLKKFDIDYLKIDQSFVHNLKTDHNDLALCEAIIVMAHKLGIKVIAEGVETAVQRDLLAAAGCDYAQGYFYSRPVPAEEFEKLLKHDNL